MSYKVVTDVSHYNAIASKIQVYGSDKKLKPSEMSGAIDSIVSDAVHRGINEGLLVGEVQGRAAERDEFWETFQRGGQPLKAPTYAFAYGRFNDNNYFPKYPIKSVTGDSCYFMFAESGISKTKVPIIVEGSDFRGGFRWCTKLKEVVQLVVNEKTLLGGSFDYCSGLEYIRFSGVIGCSVDFVACSNLTRQSILGDVATAEQIAEGKNLCTIGNDTYYGGIFGALRDVSGGTALTLTLNPTARGRLTETEIAYAQNKGWNVA